MSAGPFVLAAGRTGGHLFPAQALAKYPFLRRFHPGQVEGALWDDRMLFILLSAVAVGLVSVVLWDTLFPARRDAFVTAAPVRVDGTIVAAVGTIHDLGRSRQGD